MSTHTSALKLHSVRATLGPLRWLSPFSVSIAATRANFEVHRSVAYLAYVTSTLVACTTVLGIFISNRDVPKASAFIDLGSIATNWVCHIYNTLRLLIKSKKNKVKKLIDEIEQLDRLLVTINVPIEPCSNSGVYVIVLVLLHSSMLTILIYTEAQQAEWLPLVGAPALVTFTLVSLDAELLCSLRLVALLAARLHCLAAHLQHLLRCTHDHHEDFDILLCYRKILHILKRINTIWQPQILMILVLEFYFALKSFQIIKLDIMEFANLREVLRAYVKCAAAARHAVLVLALGASGQRLAARCDRLLQLAGLVSDSHLTEGTRGQGAAMVAVGRAGGARLRALACLPVDGALTLTVFGGVVAAHIFCVQIGVTL